MNKKRKKRQSVRYIVFKEGSAWYVAALELNIVESGDDPREVLLFLLEAIEGYVESAKKIKAGPAILNQKPDPEYEKLWNDALDVLVNRSLKKLSKKIYMHGEKALAPA